MDKGSLLLEMSAGTCSRREGGICPYDLAPKTQVYYANKVVTVAKILAESPSCTSLFGYKEFTGKPAVPKAFVPLEPAGRGFLPNDKATVAQKHAIATARVVKSAAVLWKMVLKGQRLEPVGLVVVTTGQHTLPGKGECVLQ